MYKVINGRRYNTETATKVAEWENMDNVTDPHWYKEDLFRKKNGEFFIHGVGGPASKYSKATGMNSWSGDEKIVPITYDEAKEWAERLEEKDYDKLFGDPEGGSRKLTNFTLDPLTVAKLKRAAGNSGKSMSEIISELVLKNL